MINSIINKYLNQPKREFILAIILFTSILFSYIFEYYSISNYIYPIIFFVSIIGSIPIISVSLKFIYRRKITIEVFNLFALLVAFFLASPLAAIWIELMLTFASYLEWKTKERASGAIKELLSLAPDFAHKEINNTYIDIKRSEIVVGDILLVKAGEKIPTDGTIIFGECTVDESSFTGESVPVEKSLNNEVYEATTINKGVIKVKVTKVGSDTVLGRMVVLMRSALSNKSTIHKFADRFAEFFLPFSAIVAIVIYLLTHNPIMVASFLLVVCADDVAVAIPLAIEASLGKAAKRGVIIKGGINLEKLSKIKTVIFDKTGTLTYGKFSVDFVNLKNDSQSEQFWRCVAIAEKFSEHPIGKEIYKHAINIIGEVDNPDKVEVLTGVGIKVKKGDSVIVIGNKVAMNISNVEIVEKTNNLNTSGKTILYVSLNDTYIGTIYVSDTVKIEAKDVVAELHKNGIHTVILTGDQKDIANDIGNKIGIKEIRSGLFPEEKLNAIAEFSKHGGVVMVGDGVNDAPALAKSDVGIAMGKLGAAVSVEAADIIIQTDNLSRIPEVIELAKQTRTVIRNNIIIWLFSNIIGTILVITNIFGITLAAFYNFISDFFPLINSARLFRNKR